MFWFKIILFFLSILGLASSMHFIEWTLTGLLHTSVSRACPSSSGPSCSNGDSAVHRIRHYPPDKH